MTALFDPLEILILFDFFFLCRVSNQVGSTRDLDRLHYYSSFTAEDEFTFHTHSQIMRDSVIPSELNTGEGERRFKVRSTPGSLGFRFNPCTGQSLTS